MDHKPEVSGTTIALCLGAAIGLLIAFSISPWLGIAALVGIGLWPKKDRLDRTHGELSSFH